MRDPRGAATTAGGAKAGRVTIPRARIQITPALIAAAFATLLLMALYLATMAPDLTFWDSSEFITAAHTLGIPHPPGTPLWTLLARVSAMVFANAGPVRAVTTLSVLASALAGGLGASMLTRWIGVRNAVAAAVSAGAMMTVWSNATETEVYAVALLLSAAMLAAGERAGRYGASDDERRRWRALIAFLAALAIPLHLSAMVALPAAVVFAWRGARPTVRDALGWAALSALALSAVAVLPIRAMMEPALDSGHPVTLRALLAVLQRAQFAVPGLWPRSAPIWLQLGNVFQWADWQVAFGLHPQATPAVTRTAMTLLWTWFGIWGLRALWKQDARAARAMLTLVICGSFGVAVYLNMRAGPSFGTPLLPSGAMHEARERDYFFVLGFWAWGLLAGAGIASLATLLIRRLVPVSLNATAPRRARLLASAVSLFAIAVAAVPLVANRSTLDRTQQPLAALPRVFARLLLDAVPERGVLFTAGDNDTFPLWYLQQVEGYRRDVTVVTVPLLGASTFRDELRRRHNLLPADAVAAWPGLDRVLQLIAERALMNRREYRVSSLLARTDRNRIDPSRGWSLEGLVYAPAQEVASGHVALDLPAMTRSRDLVPPSALRPLPAGVDWAGQQVQELLRCSAVTSLADTLLVSACNGA